MPSVGLGLSAPLGAVVIGFDLGLAGLPVVIAIAVQAFLTAQLGIAFSAA
ncbi:hypothetical protein [Mycobacterium haemophilum]|nr:hypothetical protein [Mycobacterium haemophilum]